MDVRQQEQPTRMRREPTAGAGLRSPVLRCCAVAFVVLPVRGLVGYGKSAAQPALAAEPAQLARDLVADEQALRDPSSSDAVLQAAALRQQAAYRAIGRHPEWEPIVR